MPGTPHFLVVDDERQIRRAVAHVLEMLNGQPERSLLVGDSVTDVEAGRAAGVRVIGLAKTRQRGRELLDAGAVALIERWRQSQRGGCDWDEIRQPAFATKYHQPGG